MGAVLNCCFLSVQATAAKNIFLNLCIFGNIKKTLTCQSQKRVNIFYPALTFPAIYTFDPATNLRDRDASTLKVELQQTVRCLQ